MMLPLLSMSMFSAAGCFGKPGIVIIFPVKMTINSAPAFKYTSLTWIVNGSLHYKFFGSSDKEFCVLAMQIGKLS